MIAENSLHLKGSFRFHSVMYTTMSAMQWHAFKRHFYYSVLHNTNTLQCWHTEY